MGRGDLSRSSASADHHSAEGGSSDVAAGLLGCVRVPLSRARRKRGVKPGGKRSWKAAGERTHRGRTHGRADMEGSAEEDHKEKLLWNVKREVGGHLRFYFCAISCQC